jgi:hypothetical protein
VRREEGWDRIAGYGIILPEIWSGLADVDRASLEATLESGGCGRGRYHVLPDRVVLYGGPDSARKSMPRHRSDVTITIPRLDPSWCQCNW